MGKVRATVNITDRDMVANPLTKHISRQCVFDNLLATGELYFQDAIYYRKSRDLDPMGDCDLDSLWSKQLHTMD